LSCEVRRLRDVRLSDTINGTITLLGCRQDAYGITGGIFILVMRGGNFAYVDEYTPMLPVPASKPVVFLRRRPARRCM